jgi:hydrogenase maturation factor
MNNSAMSSASPAGISPLCQDEHCVTCGDIAERMRVLRIDEARQLALCADEGGEHHTVEIALVLPVAVNDALLVHAGTAIAGTPGREVEEVAGS